MKFLDAAIGLLVLCIGVFMVVKFYNLLPPRLSGIAFIGLGVYILRRHFCS